MKTCNCRLVQKHVWLAISIVKLAQEILKLLSMAFNYNSSRAVSHPQDGCARAMDIQV